MSSIGSDFEDEQRDAVEGRDPRRAVEVPYDQLDPATLRRVIEDIVTRDGTDYGEIERTTEQKAEGLMRELQSGKAALVVDLETESIGVMTREQLDRIEFERTGSARTAG